MSPFLLTQTDATAERTFSLTITSHYDNKKSLLPILRTDSVVVTLPASLVVAPVNEPSRAPAEANDPPASDTPPEASLIADAPAAVDKPGVQPSPAETPRKSLTQRIADYFASRSASARSFLASYIAKQAVAKPVPTPNLPGVDATPKSNDEGVVESIPVTEHANGDGIPVAESELTALRQNARTLIELLNRNANTAQGATGIIISKHGEGAAARGDGNKCWFSRNDL